MEQRCANDDCKYLIAPNYFELNKYCRKNNIAKRYVGIYENYDKILDRLIDLNLYCVTCCVKSTFAICHVYDVPIPDNLLDVATPLLKAKNKIRN